MKILLFVFVASILWYFGKLITDVIREIIFERLHKSKGYRIVCGKQKRISDKKSSKVESITGGKIGF